MDVENQDRTSKSSANCGLIVRGIDGVRDAVSRNMLLRWIASQPYNIRGQTLFALKAAELADSDLIVAMDASKFENSGEPGYFVAQSIFSDWLPSSVGQIDILGNVANHFATLSSGDMSRGVIFSSWRKLIATRPDDGFKILDGGVVSSVRSTFLVATLDGIRDARPDEAFDKCLEMLDGIENDQRAALLALSGFILTQNEIDVFVPRLHHLAASSNDVMGDLISLAYLKLCQRSYALNTSDLIQRLSKAVEAGGAAARFRLYEVLWRTPDGYADIVIAFVIQTMAEMKAEEIGCLDRIGMWLGSLDILRQFHLVRATALAIARSELSLSHKELEWFRGNMQSKHSALLMRLILELLIHPDTRISRQAVLLGDRLENEPRHIDKLWFLSDPRYRALIIARMMGACVFEHGIALSIAIAVTNSASKNDIGTLVGDFTGFWLRNYPTDLAVILDSNRQGPVLNERAKAAFLEVASPFVSRTDNLKYDNAFATDIEAQLVQRAFALERSRDVRENANKMSVFADIVSTQHILHGAETVSTVYRGSDNEAQRQVTPMTSISHELRVPRMSVFCPVHYQYMRIILQSQTLDA